MTFLRPPRAENHRGADRLPGRSSRWCLASGLSSVALFHLFYASQAGANGEILPAVRAARIAGIVRKAQEAPHRDLAQLLQSAHSPAVSVERVPLQSLGDLPAPRCARDGLCPGDQGAA